jgi:hypothetical protein
MDEQVISLVVSDDGEVASGIVSSLRVSGDAGIDAWVKIEGREIPVRAVLLRRIAGGAEDKLENRAIAIGSMIIFGAARFELVVDAVVPEAVPGPEWFAQAQRNATERAAFLDEFGALDSSQVGEFAGSKARNRRATAYRWQEAGQIFSVTNHGKTLYPGFQFERDEGRPLPVIAEVLAVLPPTMRGWALGLWWSTPNPTLSGRRPVDLLVTEPDAVVDAARDEAQEWAQADAVAVNA